MATHKKLSIGRFDYAIFSAFFSYSAGIQVIPIVLVIMSEDLGFSLRDGGFAEGSLLQVARWIPGIFSALLCGFIAAKYGKRKTLGVSTAFIAIGMILCAIAPDFLLITISLMIAGAANGIIGTLSSPFVRDLHPNESGRYLNFLNSFWSIGTLFTVIVTGGLLSLGVSWRILIFSTGLLSLIPTFLLLLPQSNDNKYPESPKPPNSKEVLSQMLSVLKDRRFMLFFSTMGIHAGGEGVLMYWSASYIQLNFAGTAWAAGVGAGLFALGMIIGRALVGYFVHQNHFKNAIIYCAVFGVLLTIGFPRITDLWLLFIVLFFSGIATAPIWPSLISHASERLGHLDKTMTMILLTLSAAPGRAFFMALVGYIATVTGGLTDAFYIVPAYFTIVAVMVYIEGKLEALDTSNDTQGY